MTLRLAHRPVYVLEGAKVAIRSGKTLPDLSFEDSVRFVCNVVLQLTFACMFVARALCQSWQQLHTGGARRHRQRSGQVRRVQDFYESLNNLVEDAWGMGAAVFAASCTPRPSSCQVSSMR
ncbi:hypothetical protein PF004_g24744, partial [Phytophthora fragariae]